MSHHPGPHSAGGAPTWKGKLINPNPRTPRGGGMRERQPPIAAKVELKILRKETRMREAAAALRPRRSPPPSTALDRARDTERRVRLGGSRKLSR